MEKALLFLFIFCLTFISCNKDDGGKEFCVTCTIKSTATITGFDPSVTQTTLDQCGLTQEALDEYLKSGNSTITSTSGDATVTVKTETTCTKK